MQARTDTFRKQYRKLSETEIALIHQIKSIAEQLEDLLNANTPQGRERYIALAKTALEESVMWATKAIS